jgi:xanthine/CO dehydrogenase XdhC/CoxF family maturation factor
MNPLSDNELRQTAQDWREAGRGVAIATVVETWGSAPRATGSHLIVDHSGHFIGSVSGGCLEGEVILQAQETIETGASRLLEFGIEDETAWRVGLPCGGRVKIYVEKLA